ncbi:uncharacterized protein LOC104886554 [Beta vulgaris subsp. vulgaris]|uniref:uncharacterized protein LOC104886554 n=1 Tax=Beta vulgaris subsp. vulgaris TaxID=3555 RepID=UPI002547D441|nr:uncharacterized protein LOC104886554 [Beta vulgaris subsp. vulgaris]
MDQNPSTPGGDGSNNRIPIGDYYQTQQLGDDDDAYDDDDEDEADQGGKGKNKILKERWGHDEDIALVSGYLNCGGDPLVGTDQSKAKLWIEIKRIYDAEVVKKPSLIHRRTMKSIKAHWRTINRLVTLWVSQLGEAERMKSSGMAITDVEAKAHELYKQKQNNKAFKLYHCWMGMRHLSRWQPGYDSTVVSQSSSKRSSDEVVSVRPDGQKKAKAQRKMKGVATSLDDFNNTLSEMQVDYQISYASSSFLSNYERTRCERQIFQQLPDATGKLGASSHQKCTAALRCLAYGSASDAVDEYIKIAESTAKECLVHFVQGIRKVFTNEYLRRPTVTDLQRLLRDGERRGFPGMMGSIDCMHWQWKNCPRAWKGLYQGRSKSATVILEAVASGDLWIWHAFFGTPGTCNDINVLARSPVFDDLYQGRAPEVTFNVNGNTYNRGYYLTDGIYPKWAVFMPAIRLPLSPVDELFTKRQESVRKDVERAFGVLQARFAIIQRPSLIWDEHLMWEIMLACIILHNMIVEDERDTYLNYQDASDFEQENASIASTSSSHRLETFYVQPGRYNDIGMQQYLQNRADAWIEMFTTPYKRTWLNTFGTIVANQPMMSELLFVILSVAIVVRNLN